MDGFNYKNYDPQTAAALRWKEAAQHRAAADLLIREAGEELQAAQDRLVGARYSIVRAISAAADVRGLCDGVEREVSEELAQVMGYRHDPNRPWIPWTALTHRVLIAGTGTLGGNLVGRPTTPAADALFAVSTVVRLGAQVIDGLVGNLAVPRVSANATASWPGESGTAAASDQSIAQIACAPKRVAAYTEISKTLLKQEPGKADQMIARNLLGVVGAGLDAALIAGTGTNQPTGITRTSGITLTTGTAFDHAAAQAMIKVAATANVVDENIRMLAPPATRELFAKRGVNGTAAEAGFIWQRNAVADKPAYVSANAPAATLIVGDFAGLLVLLWGGGVQLEINPFAGFQSDIVGMKASAYADLAVTQPGGWAVSTGIT